MEEASAKSVLVSIYFFDPPTIFFPCITACTPLPCNALKSVVSSICIACSFPYTLIALASGCSDLFSKEQATFTNSS